MKLNLSKGNMYKFISHTGNTIKGLCPHGCRYCYMKQWGKQKPVRLDETELTTGMTEGNFIFVGSSCDMFAQDIKVSWIQKTLEYLKQFDNRYLFQSKNPKGFDDYIDMFPEDSVFCTTIETNRHYPDIMNNCPSVQDRALNMQRVSEYGLETYVTVEPIMDFDLQEMVGLLKQCNPQQINIGANTSKVNLPEPPKEKILQLITELEKFTKVEQKSNLKRLLK